MLCHTLKKKKSRIAMFIPRIFLEKKDENKMFNFFICNKERTLKAEIERHNSQTREKMRDGSVVTIAQASEYIDSELGLSLSTWHETWTKLPNWEN